VKNKKHNARLLDPKSGYPSPKDRAAVSNLMGSWYVEGKSQLLHGRGRRYAAQLYRQNWDGCRELWKEHLPQANIVVRPAAKWRKVLNKPSLEKLSLRPALS
jgi:hypothetical protein